MLHTAHLISKIIFVSVLATALTSCSLFDKPPERPDRLIKQIAPQRIYFANYDLVWTAAHAALRYAIAQENIETGVIETEFIKGMDGYMAPNQLKPASAGVRYKLILLFAKVKSENGKESVRVTIEKRIERLRDFFSEPETIETDGLEEKVIFYRMDRELIIRDALKKAAASGT